MKEKTHAYTNSHFYQVLMKKQTSHLNCSNNGKPRTIMYGYWYENHTHRQDKRKHTYIDTEYYQDAGPSHPATFLVKLLPDCICWLGLRNMSFDSMVHCTPPAFIGGCLNCPTYCLRLPIVTFANFSAISDAPRAFLSLLIAAAAATVYSQVNHIKYQTKTNAKICTL